MKAVIYTTYGTPDQLQLIEVEKPLPKDDEVLIRVHAVSINSWDWDMLRGSPIFVRMWGLFKPKYRILGADVAGRIESVGRNVKRFKPGDDVFGDLAEFGWGSLAEYVCAPEKALELKPPAMTFEQAAAFPQAGALALQSVKDSAQIKPGQKVLINGAGGGVGTLAVQMAKSFGAEVTAVDSDSKLGMLLSIGADHVIDYKREDFTKNGKHYDVIIDVISNRSIFEYKNSLTPQGIFIMLGGTVSAIFKAMLFGPMISNKNGKRLSILGYKSNKDLDMMAKLFLEGKVTPVIDRIFPLSETADAFRYFGEGTFKGKVVVKID